MTSTKHDESKSQTTQTQSQYTLDTSRFLPFIEEMNKSISSQKISPQEMLSSSMKNIIKPEDTNFYIPQNILLFSTVFPQSPHLIKGDMYEKIDINTLMFIFFFQNDSNIKYNAGKELSKRGWMYSKKYSTWFILTSPPKVKNDEFIEGKFKYWDFSNEWTTAYKKDFKFEMKHLEKFD